VHLVDLPLELGGLRHEARRKALAELRLLDQTSFRDLI
jgi:hypothetical protein